MLATYLLALVLRSPVAVDSPQPQPSPALRPPARVLGLELEKATFEQVTAHFGLTKVQHNAMDAAASANLACYRGSDGTELVFKSNNEMAGGQQITSVQLAERAKLVTVAGDDIWAGYVPPPAHGPHWGLPDCALTPAVSRSLDLGLGVQLGMDQEAVSKVLGKADKSKTNLVLWSYTLEDKEKRCESDVTLTVVLEANRVVVIDVAQVTSC